MYKSFPLASRTLRPSFPLKFNTYLENSVRYDKFEIPFNFVFIPNLPSNLGDWISIHPLKKIVRRHYRGGHDLRRRRRESERRATKISVY